MALQDEVKAIFNKYQIQVDEKSMNRFNTLREAVKAVEQAEVSDAELEGELLGLYLSAEMLHDDYSLDLVSEGIRKYIKGGFVVNPLEEAGEDSGDIEGNNSNADNGDSQESNFLSDVPDTIDDEGSNEDSENTEDETTDDANAAETQTSFKEQYPDVDSDSLLETLYKEWLASTVNKPFYKTIKSYRGAYDDGTLNILNKVFLFKLIKAISSCITHLSIEAEIKASAILLFETYYDELVACMNNIVHATSKEDILVSYEYMLQFLRLDQPVDSASNSVSTSQTEDDSGINF